MGYELWTSPVTGYRRTGTRLKELRHLFEDGITARAILEPLQSCPAGAPASEMSRILRERDFDVAGVQEIRDGEVIGFVIRDSLKNGVVRDSVQQLTLERLISDSTPLAHLLAILKTREQVFVLAGQKVAGIITRADLNKPPVRVYLFGLISLLEMHLTFWIKTTYPDGSWTKVISGSRVTKAKDLLVERTKRKQQTDLVDCLQLCDKRTLVLASKNLADSLGLDSDAKDFLTRAEMLRDFLAHSQQDLTEGSSWAEVIGVVELAEKLVDKSDGLVEEKARQAAKGRANALWS